MSDKAEDVELLLEAVKSRQKFPRACIDAYDRINEGDHNTTERIFFDTGGASTWLAYVVTKRAAESTAHASGKVKRQRLLEHIEAQTVESRRTFASQVAIAIQPERERIESIIKTSRQQPDRGRRSRLPEGDEDHREQQAEDTPENIPPTPGASASCSVDDQQNATAWVAEASGATGPEGFLTNASIAECARLFPPYMAASINRKADPTDARGLVAAVSITSEGLLQLEVANNKVEHIAKELFGAHIETGNGLRYIYLHGTTKAMPNPSLILKGCRPGAIRELLGARIAEAVSTTDAFQKELREGRGDTDCVSMSVPREALDSAEICILLPSSEAALLRAKLSI